MKKVGLSLAIFGASVVPALAGGGGAAAPADGLRDGVLQAIHMIGHFLGLI